MNTIQLETARALLLEEIDDRDRRVEIHEKCIEPFDANVRSLEAALREGRMTQAEFEDRRHANARCSTKTVFEKVIDNKVVKIELDKVRRGTWIPRDPNLPKIRRTLERELESNLIMSLCRT
jgi:hypothetical protein